MLIQINKTKQNKNKTKFFMHAAKRYTHATVCDEFLNETFQNLQNAFYDEESTNFNIDILSQVTIHPKIVELEDVRIYQHIQKRSKSAVFVSCLLLKNTVTVNFHFVFEQPKLSKSQIEKRAQLITCMLRFLSHYVSLPSTIHLYLYFSSMKKKLPLSKDDTIGFFEVNTGFTFINGDNSIFIFREEEWFKVLIHECFHCFQIDFASSYDNTVFEPLFHSLFPVNSTFLVYESYTEFWAEIINIAIYAFLKTPNRIEATRCFYKSLATEQAFKLRQMHKVLQYMNGLTYNDIIQRSKRAESYKETSNVFCYYVLTTILICSFDAFLKWCKENNPYSKNIMYSGKTPEYVHAFYGFVSKHYRQPQKHCHHHYKHTNDSLRMTSIEYEM